MNLKLIFGLLLPLTLIQGCSTTASGKFLYMGSHLDDSVLSAISTNYDRPIVIMGDRAYLPSIRCVTRRYIEAAAKRRQLNGNMDKRGLGALTETRGLGGDTKDRTLGASSIDRELGSGIANRSFDSDSISRSLMTDKQKRSLGGDSNERLLEGANQSRALAKQQSIRTFSGDELGLECTSDPEGMKISRATKNAKFYYFRYENIDNHLIDWL